MTCGLATALEPPHFNHAPVRGATGASFSRRSRAGSFNPRTRVGCDRCWKMICPIAGMFQSTHPRGVRHLCQHGGCFQAVVSIHAPAWGATPMLGASANSAMFQSTHPRGVRPGRCGRGRGTGLVSIHAPAWGATHAQSSQPFIPPVSIHAPAWGATQELVKTPLQRGVSIHAPAWGATTMGTMPELYHWLFQSTHPRGVRLIPPKNCRLLVQFQSTHPRGVRLPRPGLQTAQQSVSIHAPAWGAT